MVNVEEWNVIRHIEANLFFALAYINPFIHCLVIMGLKQAMRKYNASSKLVYSCLKSVLNYDHASDSKTSLTRT